MASIIGEGLGSPAIEQDPSIAQLQSAQLGTESAIAVALPPTGFVGSIDGLTGLLTFSDGANISITNDGVSNFTFSVTGLGATATAKTNIAAASPTPGNDEFEGYAPFSLWIDNTIPATPTVYICCDASTAAAVWVALN